MKNGRGVLYYPNGGYYDGQWKDDKMHGFGKSYSKNKALVY